MTTTTIDLTWATFQEPPFWAAMELWTAVRTAYIDDRGAMTYAELDERSRRFAAALTALGLRREERVLLLMHDTVDWPVAFLGALYAGIVPVAVNTLLTADDYAYMLAHSRATVLHRFPQGRSQLESQALARHR